MRRVQVLVHQHVEAEPEPAPLTDAEPDDVDAGPLTDAEPEPVKAEPDDVKDVTNDWRNQVVLTPSSPLSDDEVSWGPQWRGRRRTSA